MRVAKIWIRFACGIMAALCLGLLETGTIPPESAWVGILGLLGSVAGLIAGEVTATRNYTASRTEVKVAEMTALAQRAVAAATATAVAAKKNPPPPVKSGLD
jgi:hypothetical protein